MPISDRIKPKKVNEPVTTNQDELNGFIDFDDDLPIIVGQLTPNDLNLGGILTIGEKGADGYSPWVEFKPIESSESSENLSGNKVIIHYHDDYGIERKVEFDVLDGNGISSITQEEDSEGYYHLHIILDNSTEITTDRISGLSAYEVAVNNGFIGTEEEWLASLKGEKGDKGKYYYPSVDSEGNLHWEEIDDGESSLPLPEDTNINGPVGPQGEQGPQGEVGPYYIPHVDENGNITWTGTSSEIEPIDPANIKGGIYVPERSSEGIIWVYFPDADSSDRPTTIPLSDITGPKGDTGATGPQGKPGDYYWPSVDEQGNIIWYLTSVSAGAPPQTIPESGDPINIKGDYYIPRVLGTGDQKRIVWYRQDSTTYEEPGVVYLNELKGDIGPQGPQGPIGNTGGHYVPQVKETSEGKYIIWIWTPESSESSELPSEINLNDLKGDKGDTGERGPVTEITSIEPTGESSEGSVEYTVYGKPPGTREEVELNKFYFDLGQIIWDCGDSIYPLWDEPEGEV